MAPTLVPEDCCLSLITMIESITRVMKWAVLPKGKAKQYCDAKAFVLTDYPARVQRLCGASHKFCKKLLNPGLSLSKPKLNGLVSLAPNPPNSLEAASCMFSISK